MQAAPRNGNSMLQRCRLQSDSKLERSFKGPRAQWATLKDADAGPDSGCNSFITDTFFDSDALITATKG